MVVNVNEVMFGVGALDGLIFLAPTKFGALDFCFHFCNWIIVSGL